MFTIENAILWNSMVTAIEILSEQLEEMNAGMEDELEYDKGEGMSMM